MTSEDVQQTQPDHTQVAQEIADRLGETKPGPRKIVASIIEVRGVEFATDVLRETLEVEENGGLMTQKGDRRRTVGGVYFFIAKGRMTFEQRQAAFPGIKDRYKKPPKKAPLDWSERFDILSHINKTGELEDVRVKLIGLPGEIQRKDDVVITKMIHTGGGSSIPAGLPSMPEDPTLYTVYMALTQWKRVEKSLKEPDKLLEIEGMCALDPELNAIAVFATQLNIRKKKQEDQAPAAKTEQASSKSNEGETKSPPPMTKTKQAAKAKVVAPPPVDVVIPDGAPADVEQKLRELYSAAQQYREKIADLESKPESQRFGLSMTQKLLANVERQIEGLIKQHS